MTLLITTALSTAIACGADLDVNESLAASGVRFRAPVGYTMSEPGAHCVVSEDWFSAAGPEICSSLRSVQQAARVFASVGPGTSMWPCADCPTYSDVRTDTLHSRDGTRLLMRAHETGGYSHATREPVWAVLIRFPDDSVVVLSGRGSVGPRQRRALEAVAATVRRESPAT